MKKISLIACAALVAGLLVSCNNATEAGTVDYNNIRKTSNENSYILTGKITTVTESETDDYTVTNGKESQSAGEKSKETEVLKFDQASAKVSFKTDSENDTNYQGYRISYYDSMGWYSYVNDLKQDWATDKWADVTKNAKQDFTDGDADTPISGDDFVISSIDGVLYFVSCGQQFEVEADEEAIAAGESFTLKVTYVDSDDSNTTYNYDADDNDKPITGRHASSGKTTVTYDLTFTAK